MPLPIQVEALHALHNLCKISRQRQEAAASAGLVPYLMNLAQMSPKQVLYPMPRNCFKQEQCSVKVLNRLSFLLVRERSCPEQIFSPQEQSSH